MNEVVSKNEMSKNNENEKIQVSAPR